MSKLKNEYGLYLMLSDKIINEIAKVNGLSRIEVTRFIWFYYINKFMLKSPSFAYKNTMLIYDKIVESKISAPAWQRLMNKLVEKNIVTQAGNRFALDHKTGDFMRQISNLITQSLYEFHLVIEGRKKLPEIRRAKSRMPKKKYGKKGRPRGSPDVRKRSNKNYLKNKNAVTHGKYAQTT